MGNPTTTPITENWHDGGFMVSQSEGHRWIDDGIVAAGSIYLPGQVLGKQTLGIASSAEKVGSVGNGTLTALSAQTKAQVGVYKAIVAIAGANAATWDLYSPAGELIDQKEYTGAGSAAVFANDQIHATITDGTIDFAVNDEFDITVAAGAGSYVNYNPSNTDGSQVPAGICYSYVNATLAAKHVGVVVRDCEVNASELVWDASVNTAPLIATGVLGLMALGIIAR